MGECSELDSPSSAAPLQWPSRPTRPLPIATEPDLPLENGAGIWRTPAPRPTPSFPDTHTMQYSSVPFTSRYCHPPPAPARLLYGATSGYAPFGAQNKLFLHRRHSLPQQDWSSQAGEGIPRPLAGDFSGSGSVASPLRPRQWLRQSSRKCPEVGGPVMWRHRRSGSGAWGRKWLRLAEVLYPWGSTGGCRCDEEAENGSWYLKS